MHQRHVESQVRVRLQDADHRVFHESAWLRLADALTLSGRELQVVQGLFDGKTEARIGADLGISPRTVHTHLERLFRKLDVHDRVGLVVRIFATYLSLDGHLRGTRVC